MNVVVMGTGPFAAPMFRALYQTRHAVAALVTQPLRPARGKHAPPPAPMREIAAAAGTPILDPPCINAPSARELLARFAPDVLVVADYGQILSAETLGVARLGGINLHGSLLPKYRGAAPINWALYHGETETGVTVIHMTPRIDAGPAIAQARLAIDPDETAVELERRLAELGAPLVCAALDRLAAGPVEALPQDASQATPARRLRKSDGQVDWSRPAEAIRNQVRALEPWPRTSVALLRRGADPASALHLILGRVSVRPAERAAQPGEVVAVGRDELIAATGDGWLALDEVQPAGKRRMLAAEFLRGHRVAPGDHFVPTAAPQQPESS